MSNYTTKTENLTTDIFLPDSVEIWKLENKPKKESTCNISCFKEDAKIKIKSPEFEKPPKLTERNYKPGKIKNFSKKSFKNLKFTMKNADFNYYAFITLTYPENFIKDGELSKKHLNAFLQFLRRRKIRYIWCKEFQGNESPHYHIAVNKFIYYKDVAERWTNIINGNEDSLKAGTQIKKINNPKHAQRYIKKYFRKEKSKIVPENYTHVGRFWGASRNIAPKTAEINITGDLREIQRYLRVLKRWHKAKMRSLAKAYKQHWKWKAPYLGFTAINFSNFMDLSKPNFFNLSKIGLSFNLDINYKFT